jgi:hypothetical protein
VTNNALARATPGDSLPATPLEVIANRCASGACPTIYHTDRGTVVVQGYVLADNAGIAVPEGEAVVEIPVELLADAARSLLESAGSST